MNAHMNAPDQASRHRHKDSDLRASETGRPLQEGVTVRVISVGSACPSLPHRRQAPQPCPPEKDMHRNETDLPPEIYLG